jgi:hypothetical protein
MYRFATIFAAVALAACARSAPDPAAMRAQLAARAQALLDAYAANDQTTVLGMLDPEQFTFFGSDAAEIGHGGAELKRMMDDDFKLWHTARFGAMSQLDIRTDGRLASTMFQVPFSAGGAPPLTVRLCLVWRRSGDRWLLTQSVNTVPTSGSSARELLKP